MAKEHISVRIDKKLKDEVIKRAEENDRPQAYYVEKGLKKYFGWDK